MRGKGQSRLTICARMRITPAYAGKRAKPSDYLRPDEDHPRICGEKYALAFVRVTVIGSPPHMRGKDFETV